MSTRDDRVFPPDLRHIVKTNGAKMAKSRRIAFGSDSYELSHPLDYRFERIRAFAMTQLRAYDVDNFLAAVQSSELKEVSQSDDVLRLDRAVYRFKNAESSHQMALLMNDYLGTVGTKANISLDGHTNSP